MIINKQHKFIFIGLSLRGSSAISKELLENYECESLFHKHSNIPLLKQEYPNINLNEYFIFAVYRDPVQIAFTSFNKLLTNPYGIFTDPKYFSEYGGFVDKKRRNTYHKYQKREITFEQHLLKVYKYHPYDDSLSINKNYINYLMDFENLSNEFENVLKIHFGIKPVRKLPIYNKTKKKNIDSKISDYTFSKIFEPYLVHNKILYHPLYQFRGVSRLKMLWFNLYSKYKQYQTVKYDQKQKNNKFSIEDLKNER